jgi:hypothetical protein
LFAPAYVSITACATANALPAAVFSPTKLATAPKPSEIIPNLSSVVNLTYSVSCLAPAATASACAITDDTFNPFTIFSCSSTVLILRFLSFSAAAFSAASSAKFLSI